MTRKIKTVIEHLHHYLPLQKAGAVLWMVMLLLSACARMGSPDGGWFDEDPPRVVSSTPGDHATNVTSKKVTIRFDEFVKIGDVSQNVIISPPQQEAPDIKATGKNIVVQLKDSLKPNMTYTIDFSDAITDFHEDNPMGNYTYTFSTGTQIDTLEMSGHVIDAATLEPIKGILVGLYNDLADSAFRTKPMLRVARTDSHGHFVIKGVAPGQYRVYALKDADDNYMFSQKSEILAYSHDIYQPSVAPSIRQDTIWRDALHIDSIAQVPYLRYQPDDIVLLAFQEVQTDRFFLKSERKDADRINLFFSYGSDQLPVLRGLNFNSDHAFILESNDKKDSLTYWLRDTLLVNQDTLRFAMDYQMTDTLGHLVMKTDTIEALAKTPYAKRQKALQKEYDEWKKEQDKRKKREEPYDSIFPVKALNPTYNCPSMMDPDRSISIEMPTPLEKLDTAAIHLYTMIDSLWYRTPFVFQQRDSMLRQFVVIADWQPEREYSFEVDSAAFVDIYGLVSKEFKQGIKVKSMDDYATLFLQLNGVTDSNIIVQLLDKNDHIVKQVQADQDKTAQFYYLSSNTYYARAFVDLNGNGIWDTGCYAEDLQAEPVYYYPGKIEVKAKWDLTKTWNLTAQPRNRQKPGELIKQKGEDKKKTVGGRNAERAKQLGIEYIKP